MLCVVSSDIFANRSEESRLAVGIGHRLSAVASALIRPLLQQMLGHREMESSRRRAMQMQMQKNTRYIAPPISKNNLFATMCSSYSTCQEQLYFEKMVRRHLCVSYLDRSVRLTSHSATPNQRQDVCGWPPTTYVMAVCILSSSDQSNNTFQIKISKGACSKVSRTTDNDGIQK